MELVIDSDFDSSSNSWLVKINGEVDLFNSNDMKSKLLSLLSQKQANLIIECGGLEYIDSTALGALVAVLKNAKEYGCDVVLENVKPNIEKLFRITNLDKVFGLDGGKNE